MTLDCSGLTGITRRSRPPYVTVLRDVTTPALHDVRSTSALRLQTVTTPPRSAYSDCHRCATPIPRLRSLYSSVSARRIVLVMCCLCPVARFLLYITAPSPCFECITLSVLESYCLTHPPERRLDIAQRPIYDNVSRTASIALEPSRISSLLLLSSSPPYLVYVFPLGRHSQLALNSSSGAHREGKSVDIPSISSHFPRYHLVPV